MFPARLIDRRLLPLVALAVAMVGGCAGLPRIDPSGEQILIFPGETPPAAPGTPVLPPPVVGNAPLVADPFAANGLIAPPPGNLPAPPVYATSSPSWCPLLDNLRGPAVIGPVAAIPQDRLTLTPQRVLAPVGSEVVLQAAVCGASGYQMTNRRIEWTLGQQGAGQFVEIGDEGQPDVLRWPWERPKKIDNNYAVGYTSPFHTCLRRNAIDPGDDIQIRPGDAWISVTSATEGTSYVTAVAPSVEDWAARKASTIIYWVDAQWALPPSATVQAGQPHTLTTTVTRQSDGAPIAGWIVRYEVTDGAAARLGYEAGQTAEATTDGSGQASVQITPTDDQPGTSNVRITIVRPAQAGAAASPRLDVGSGQASITWGADVPATGLPPVVVEPQPQPQPQDPPVNPPPVTPTPAGRPELDVQMRRDTADPIRVGDTVTYTIIVRNNGDAPARNIEITDEFDRGLSNEYDTRGESKVVYDQMSDLGPRESDQVQLEFQVNEPGQRRHQVTVTADGATDAFTRDSFEAAPLRLPMPQLKVTMRSLNDRVVLGETAKFVGVVENIGTTAAQNLSVRIKHDAALEAADIEGTPRPTELSGGWEWKLARLEPGQRQQFRYQCNTLQSVREAFVRMFVSADGGAEKAVEDSVEILPRISPADGAAGPAIGPAGLDLVVKSNVNPAQVGRRATLTVIVSNKGATPQRNVILEVAFPPQITAEDQSIQPPQFAREGNILTFGAITELRAGGPETILIPYTPNAQGSVRIQARVRSTETPQHRTSDESIEIQPRS